MKLRHNLYRQILTIVCIMFVLIYVSMAIILPKILIPFYEKNIYLYLQTPLDVVRDDINLSEIDTDVAYIYEQDGYITSSNNLNEVINLPAKQILENIKSENGKFEYNDRTYYYSTKDDGTSYKVSITNDDYVRSMRADILEALFPVLIITLLLMLVIVTLWSQSLAQRIKHLKDKVDNLDNENYVDKYNYKLDDELKVLNNAIDEMKLTLHKQEEYKNQMYQNISHDFKTPITVMKAYVDATEDGVETKEKALEIIKEQLNKLEIKVHSLLYLNKLNYFKDKKENMNVKHDVSLTINAAVDKFKITRPDVEFALEIDKKNKIFRGSADMWEAIIDNILNNFMRYADKKVSITVKNNKIILYNDGPKIDDNVLNNIFTPYEKGVKGVFGLGLSIVKKTLHFLNYDIDIENDKKKGVRFIIKEKKN